MVVLANNSDKSIHRQEGIKYQIYFLLYFRLLYIRKSAITRPSLLLAKNGFRHLVPHVILHLMKYRSSIFLKMAARADRTETR